MQSSLIPALWAEVIEKILQKYQMQMLLAKPLIDYMLNSIHDIHTTLLNASWQSSMQNLLNILDPYKFTSHGIPSALRNNKFLLTVLESPLLEARILDSIAKNLQKNAFIAAGGMHIANLDEYLVKLGYKFIGAYGYTMQQMREGTSTAIGLVEACNKIESI